MALFFDQEWFDQQLKSCGLTRDDVAKSLRLMRSEVDEIWKDQREISSNEVTMLARLLQAPASEVVTRAGISTPAPDPADNASSGTRSDNSVVMGKLEEMDDRLRRIERAVAELQSLIIAIRPLE